MRTTLKLKKDGEIIHYSVDYRWLEDIAGKFIRMGYTIIYD